MKVVKAFAPATVANLACGFDVLGLALDTIGDTVEIRASDGHGIKIIAVEGDNGVLPLSVDKNTAGVAVLSFLELARSKGIQGCDQGLDIFVYKGLPLGSGLGSSAASSVAALVAVNRFFDDSFTRAELVTCAMEAERIACGAAHADNVAPSLLGGIVLVRSYEPLDLVSLDYPEDLFCAVVTPAIELKTSDSRRVLRRQIRLADAIKQWGNVAGLVAGLLKSDYDLISRSLVDDLIEPERAILIPGFYQVKAAAVAAGALGCSISGSGPSIFALAKSEQVAKKVGEAMINEFTKIELSSYVVVSGVNQAGAKIIE
jgi:homoserine kinase